MKVYCTLSVLEMYLKFCWKVALCLERALTFLWLLDSSPQVYRAISFPLYLLSCSQHLIRFHFLPTVLIFSSGRCKLPQLPGFRVFYHQCRVIIFGCTDIGLLSPGIMHQVKTFRKQSTKGICVNLMDRVREVLLTCKPQGTYKASKGYTQSIYSTGNAGNR